MPYIITTILPDGVYTFQTQAKAPDWHQLRRMINGYIEYVPHFTRLRTEHTGKLTRGQACVDEEGQLKNLPFNSEATRHWLDNLGPGPFRYEPRLYGPCVFYAKEPKIKQ